MAKNKYSQLHQLLKSVSYKSPIYTNPLYLLAKGTDAGIYRQIPKMVIIVNQASEMQIVLNYCHELELPLTFKAGGTSLSGQTISNSVLVELGPEFSKYTIHENGKFASFEPGVKGGIANLVLAKYGRKIGPSPASINAAKIGGIVANNASGSSYGIATNSYNTIKGMKIILLDGTLLDTSNESSREQFRKSHPELLQKLASLRIYIHENKDINTKIQHKYKLKNTCGYGVNSFIDFSDPIDILEHLMVGSEGTLGFISEVTFETIVDHPLKACALLFYDGLAQASNAIMPLRQCEVSAAELMDRKALRSVENNSGMPEILKTLGEDVAALLIETSAPTQELLDKQIQDIIHRLKDIPTLFPIEFTQDKKEFANLWKVRKGLFTSAAATRPKGTACIIEDIAFPGEVLGEALTDLQNLLNLFGYEDSVMWGHLLDGNIHFLIMPDFKNPQQMENYKAFMHQLAVIVVQKYDGSLKAEHGTGRNMAPFVEFEWGKDIYNIMKQLKNAFDPKYLLNPGVIINDDPEIFAKNIKPLPEVNELIDDCIECGFCESTCPTKDFTLTPRQRIVIYRELHRLKSSGEKSQLKALSSSYEYHGKESCATDGLCAMDCPVGINTGKLIKELRFYDKSAFAKSIAGFVANHFAGTVSMVRPALAAVNIIQKIIPTVVMKSISGFIHRISFRNVPLWNEYLPKQGPKIVKNTIPENTDFLGKVVYFPACINRMFGISKDYDEKAALTQVTKSVLEKARFQILYPEKLESLCCGMAFDSKGFKEQGMTKLKELEQRLLEISNQGEIPVLCDMSPCLLRMKDLMDTRLKLYEPVEFVSKYLVDKLIFTKLPETISIHSTCSNIKMGLDDALTGLADLCAEKVIKPSKTKCCGWAGDKGFNLPELNTSALRYLKSELPEQVQHGYSTSRTCEIGLTLHSGVSYKSILYLVDKVTKPI